jgi:hypothetical protein
LTFIASIYAFRSIERIQLVPDAFTYLINSNKILLSMGPALKLIFVLNSLFNHLFTYNFPCFTENWEKDYEFLVKTPIPKVLTDYTLDWLVHASLFFSLNLETLKLLLSLQLRVCFHSGFGLIRWDSKILRRVDGIT